MVPIVDNLRDETNAAAHLFARLRTSGAFKLCPSKHGIFYVLVQSNVTQNNSYLNLSCSLSDRPAGLDSPPALPGPCPLRGFPLLPDCCLPCPCRSNEFVQSVRGFIRRHFALRPSLTVSLTKKYDTFKTCLRAKATPKIKNNNKHNMARLRCSMREGQSARALKGCHVVTF